MGFFLSYRTIVYLVIIFIIYLTHYQTVAVQNKPNIVILMVDDLGIADLGCFGNDTIKTPNIDKLAAQGARLTHSLSSESICTPSRAAFLTGRYAVRSGMVNSEKSFRVFIFTAVPGGLPRNETTFAKSLESVGYSTAMVGKWHLGLNSKTADDFHHHPLRYGFQSFYGIPLTNIRNCDGHGSVIDHTITRKLRNQSVGAILVTALTGIMTVLVGKLRKCYFILFMILILLSSWLMIFLDHFLQVSNCFLFRNYTIVEQPLILENLTARLTNNAIEFIETNQAKPFLLYMSYLKVHTALFTTKAFKGHSHHGHYGDNVEEMDWSVGKIMETLDRLGIRNNTFVYFTSDHGPHLEEFYDGEYQGGWKGTLKGGKSQCWEGGIRVPSIASWPSQIPAGKTITEPSIDLNIFATILNIAGAPIPNDRVIDSKDIMPLLKQEVKYSPNEFMYHYCASVVHAVRFRPRHGSTVWKLYFMTPIWDENTTVCTTAAVCPCHSKYVNQHDPPLLYDITNDPEEHFPIDPNDLRYKEVASRMINAAKDHQETVETVHYQLDQFMWRPWLQSCCNYPYCKCSENVTNLQYFP